PTIASAAIDAASATGMCQRGARDRTLRCAADASSSFSASSTRCAKSTSVSTGRSARRSLVSRSSLISTRPVTMRLCAIQTLAQDRQRALQVALDRVDRHVERSCDLGRIQILLVPQQQHGARGRRQRVDQRGQMSAQQWIVVLLLGVQLQGLLERRDVDRASLSQAVDRAVCRRLAQPEYEVRLGLNGRQAPVQLQEYFLRKILRGAAIAEHAQREAVDRAL